MAKLETQLAALISRRDSLMDHLRRGEIAVDAAKIELKKFLITGSLDDADNAARLNARVGDAERLTSGIASALVKINADIGEIESQLATERDAIARKAAADQLAADILTVEKAMPLCFASVRELADAIERLGQFESTQVSAFLKNACGEAEMALAVIVANATHTLAAIEHGTMPIPYRPIEVVEPVVELIAPEPRVTLFAVRSCKWREGDKVKTTMQYEDCDLPQRLAATALRRNAVVQIGDPRRQRLHGSRGGHHANPDAVDVVDLDCAENSTEIEPIVHSLFFEPHPNVAKPFALKIAREIAREAS